MEIGMSDVYYTIRYLVGPGFVQALWAPSLVTGTIFAIVGLVSVWAALSRRHWFIRALVVAAVVSIAMTVRGHDAVLAFLLQSIVTIAGIRALRTLRFRSMRRNAAKHADRETGPDSARPARSEDTRSKYYQFSLLDLMLLALLVAVICGIIVQTPPHLAVEWPAIVIAGLSFGGLTVWLRREFAAIVFRRKQPEWLVRKPLRGGLHLTFRLFASVVIPASLMLLLFPTAYLYHRVINPLPRPAVAMPDPNGYDDLERAWSTFFYRSHGSVPDLETATQEELAAFVRDNSDVLDTIRLGLSRECRVRLTYDHRKDCSPAKFFCLMKALIAEGKLAEIEGRLDDAVASYLDVVRLAAAVSRGGLVVGALTVPGYENNAMKLLLGVIDALDRQQAERVIDSLQAITAQRESFDAVLARDRIWVDQACDKLERAREFISESSPEYAAFYQGRMRACVLRGRAHTQLAICEMAIRRYQLDHHRLPATLAELVPGYLNFVPQDPFGGRPIVYRPDSAGPILYSIGPDGRDDGGEPSDFLSTGPVVPGDVLPKAAEDALTERESL